MATKWSVGTPRWYGCRTPSSLPDNAKAVVAEMKQLKGDKKVLGAFALGDEDLFPRAEILGEFKALCLSVGPHESGGGETSRSTQRCGRFW